MHDHATPHANTPDPSDMLSTLEITRIRRRSHGGGGTWVTGYMADHIFEALVFPEHAESETYELGESRISKLWIREHASRTEAACFDRGWDREPSTPAAKAIVDLLAAGLAERIFGK